MKGYAIGRVLQPEHLKSNKTGSEKYNFGFLVGKESKKHDVWKPKEGTSKAFEACAKLKDGDLVIVDFGSGVDEKGRAVDYINDVRLCPAQLQKDLQAVFAAQ